MCKIVSILLLSFLFSCSWHPCTPEYHMQYGHLEDLPTFDYIEETPHYLLLLVCARHLDYSSGKQLLKTIARHPSDGGKNSDVGHSWILLYGDEGVLEGGHTGEFGIVQPRYFEGVGDLIERDDPNPIRYLWTAQKDGCFQKGSGGFIPTFAARLKLTPEQYRSIRDYILSERYPYKEYAITRHQCASFVSTVATLAGLELEHTVIIPIEKNIMIGGETVQLWTDSAYSQLTISTPDILEKSLMQAVKDRKALNATKWYIRHYSKKNTFTEQVHAIKNISSRFKRYYLFN